MILVDIGNSLTKMYGVTKESTFSHDYNLTLEEDRIKLENDVKLLEGETLYVSSVNSKSLATLVEATKGLDITYKILDTKVMKEYSLKAGYVISNIDILGPDLFADIVASDSKVATLVIDCGTATKFLLIDDKKEFLGGMICPGIRAFSAILDSSTDLLKTCDIEIPLKPYSLRTDEAINASATYGMAYMARGYIEEAKAKYGTLKVIITGGAGTFLDKSLAKIGYKDYTFDSMHVFKGIARSFGVASILERQ